MLKETTYKEKFVMLAPWLAAIVDSVKKDLKNEHLKKDLGFVRQYFPGKNYNKLTSEELAAAYAHALANSENGEELAEFISNRWLLKHTDLYHYFEHKLSQINPNFNEIETLDLAAAEKMMEEAITLHGAPRTYLFCVLNSVVFPDEIYKRLNKRALEDIEKVTEQKAAFEEAQSVEKMKQNYEQRIARLTDKYEKKILGLQSMYTKDVESLKKQLANLQRKHHSSKEHS